MKNSVALYKRHRFSSEIIQYVVWLYHRFNLSHNDIEDMLAENGIDVTHESIRLWCIKFGPKFANNRAELSHQQTRVRERIMRRFKSMVQAQ